jgi:uridine kinase
MKPHIIGIAGPSSSGKTELARQLVELLPGTAVVSLDSYYLPLREMPLEDRRTVNFDHPDALDWDLLDRHLRTMSRGCAFEEPVYSFADYTRVAETKRIEPGEFVIVEGLFVLYRRDLRDLLDTSVYVQTDLDVCYRRRLARDVAERGRTPDSVREQYERTVRPGAEGFVCPTKAHAHLVVSGEQPLAESTAAVMDAIAKARAAAGSR